MINFITAQLSDIPILGCLIATGVRIFPLYRNKSSDILRCLNVSRPYYTYINWIGTIDLFLGRVCTFS